MKKLFTIFSFLALIASISFAQSAKFLLKPNGEKIRIQNSNFPEIQGEVTKLSNSTEGKSNSVFRSPSSITGVNDTVSYRNSGGNFEFNFIFKGQDVMFTWFVAPNDMTIKSIGYTCSNVVADTIDGDSIYIAPVGLRLIKLNWSASQLYYFGWTYQGVYPSEGDGYGNVDPFGENATGNWIPNSEEPDKLPPWTNNADPALNTWDYDLWSNNREAWPTIPVPSSQENPVYNWLNLSSTGLGEVSLLKGEIYAVVAVHQGTNLAQNRTGIFADTTIGGNHSWKYYESSANPGWLVRAPYTFDFAVIADVADSSSEVETIAAVRIDANSDYVPDRLNEQVTVEGVVTSPSISANYYSVNIQDATGAIVVYSPSDTESNYQIGDILRVKGRVGQYKGLSQIITSSTDITLLESGTVPPTPLVVTVAALQANQEIYESMLLRINGLTKVGGVWPTEGTSQKITMADSLGHNLILRIDSDFNIDGQPEPAWPKDIIMNGGQYTTATPPNDGYQYLPRMYSDFIVDNSGFYISFKCDMSIEIAADRFHPATEVLSARGSFNGWSSTDVMTPSGANPNIYEINVPYAGEAGEVIAYKFAYRTATGDNWETGPNYEYPVTETDITNGYAAVPQRSFNNLTIENVVQQESVVRFIVDMNSAADTGFVSIDNVIIAGGNLPLQWPGSGWLDSEVDKVIFLVDDGTNGDETAGDNFWTAKVTFPKFTPTDIEYKYGANWGLVSNGGNNDNEGNGNHHVILTPSFVNGRTNDVFGELISKNVIEDSSAIVTETIAAVRIDANSDYVPDRLGDEVMIVGAITSLNVAPEAGYSVEMQDGTAGIHLWVPGDSLSNYPIGSQVQVHGTVGQYRGLTQITTTFDNIVSLGTLQIPIQVVEAAALLANPENYESELIRINNLSKVEGEVWPDTVGQSAYLLMTDGENQFILRIDSDLDIDGQPEPTWPVDIIMYGGQYTASIPPNDGYQYLPRMYSDFIVEGGECTGPNWSPVIYTNSTTAYGKVEINGISATSGDIVGAFVGDECRAVGNVVANEGEAFVTLLIQGESVETVSFKIFDSSECEILNVSYSTQTNPGNTIGTPPNYLPIYGSTTITQSFNLNFGWNLISLNVTPDTTNPASVFASILSILNEVKGTTGTYNPGVPDFLNTLDSLKDGLAYWVNVSDSVTFGIEGLPINYSALPITLQTGWNLTGYPVDQANGIENALSNIWSELEEAKDLTQSYNPNVPDFLNTLRTLVPNSGYWIRVSSDATLTYPVPSALPKLKYFVEDIKYDNWKTKYYTNSMTVYAQVVINDAQGISGLVGAFIGDECRGVGTIINNKRKSYATIVVNGDKKGKITFKVFNPSTKREISIDGEFEFMPGEIKSDIILLKGYTEENGNNLVPSTTKLYYAYPNPFNPSTVIKFDLHKDSNVILSVYNMMGELVKTITNNKFSAGSYSFRWNGKNNHNSKVSSGVYIISFRTNERADLKKVILLK